MGSDGLVLIVKFHLGKCFSRSHAIGPGPFLQTTFLLDVGIAVAAALLVSLIFYQLGLPMIVGQLVAGMLVGPFGLGLIRDTTAIDFLATLGIILLLFVVGLELDPRKFGKIGSRVLMLSTVEFLVAFSASVLSALFAGLDVGTALFLGSVLGLSSTAIVAKLILDRFPEHGENFTALMMVMVVEDVIAVFLLFLTPELAGGRQLQASGLFPNRCKGVLLVHRKFRVREVSRPETDQQGESVRAGNRGGRISPRLVIRFPIRSNFGLSGFLACDWGLTRRILSSRQAVEVCQGENSTPKRRLHCAFLSVNGDPDRHFECVVNWPAARGHFNRGGSRETCWRILRSAPRSDRTSHSSWFHPGSSRRVLTSARQYGS